MLLLLYEMGRYQSLRGRVRVRVRVRIRVTVTVRVMLGSSCNVRVASCRKLYGLQGMPSDVVKAYSEPLNAQAVENCTDCRACRVMLGSSCNVRITF